MSPSPFAVRRAIIVLVGITAVAAIVVVVVAAVYASSFFFTAPAARETVTWLADQPAMRTVCGARGAFGVIDRLAPAFRHIGLTLGPCAGEGAHTCPPLTRLMCHEGTTFCATYENVPAYESAGAAHGECISQ